MQSRLYRISPTLFGKYPKQFDKLFKNISSYQKEEKEETDKESSDSDNNDN